jgi:hypothetical protein
MVNKTPDTEDESNFQVTDRRRVTPESSQEPAEAPESQAEKTPEPSPRAETPPSVEEEPGQEFLLLSISDLVRIFIAELQTRALIHMGLIPNPQTHLVAKDFPEARLAIDCMAALIEQLSPSAAPGEHGQLQQILADLQLTYVRESGG